MTPITLTCTEQGCNNGTSNGHALYRTNAYGESFEGKCILHYKGEVDPIVKMVAEAFECEVEEITHGK